MRKRIGKAGEVEGAAGEGPSASAAAAAAEAAGSAPPRRHAKSGLCFAVSSLALLFALAAAYSLTHSAQMALMRLVRDLGRHKARVRLLGDGKGGLVPLLLGREAPLPVEGLADEETATAFSAEELAEFNGANGAPLYLAIMGRIYDVSRGAAFYGKGRSYHHYVARDASRSFATGCVKEDCLIGSLAGLEHWQRREVARWVEFYEYHDKYRFVGVLRVNPVEAAVEAALVLEEAVAGLSAEALIEAGKSVYVRGIMEDALHYWTSALVRLGEARRDNAMDTVKRRATVLMHMVGAAHKQDDTAQAVEYSQEALDGLREALGPEVAPGHPLVGRALSDRAILAFMEGEAERAVALGTQADAVYRAALAQPQHLEDAGGKDSVLAEAGNTRYNLALVHQQLGNYTAAAAVAQALLDDFRDTAEVPEALDSVLQAANGLLQEIEAAYDKEHQDGTFDDLYD